MSALGADPADLAAVETLVKRAGTSFYRGMKILPKDRRAAMYAIYGFCRIVDDVADEPGPLPQKMAGLAAWRDRIAALYRGRADEPITRVLLPAIARYHLRQEDFLAVIDGMAMDTEHAIVAPDMATLDLYCDRVAAAVGRLSVRAFGDDSADADEVAWHLGRALQLTNILRDVAEDAGRGRLYLPREWLDDAGVPPEPQAALHHKALPALCARMAAQAHRHFDQAAAAMQRCDARAMKPARLMGATYAAVLERLQQRGWSNPAQPVKLSRWQKLWIALRHL
jgi:squalene synthase HpnD